MIIFRKHNWYNFEFSNVSKFNTYTVVIFLIYFSYYFWNIKNYLLFSKGFWSGRFWRVTVLNFFILL